MDLNINDRLFLYNDLTVDQLLYILSKKDSVLDIIKVYQDSNIDTVKKEKIFVLVGEICDKGYAKEYRNKDGVEILVKITNKGRWYRITHNHTYQFLAAIAGIIALLLAIWQAK